MSVNAAPPAAVQVSAAPSVAMTAQQAPASGAGGLSFAGVAQKAVPSVVNLWATRLQRVPQPHGELFSHDPMFRDLFAPLFRRHREHKRISLGSGVIVRADGIVLTNSHLVTGAQEIHVTLSDGRELRADVVGVDEPTDIAVVRLRGRIGTLTPIALGDSARLRAGDVVLAVGNPFGVGQTVTMGIVSATGRANVGIAEFEDFIQTDAAINPGNSGGALIDLRGELVGVNTAILSRTGGYQGVGFAIPAKMIRPVMASLVDHGRVDRGWLGVAVQSLSRPFNEALGLGTEVKGALVSDVAPASPADKAGVRIGDVIVAVNGAEITGAGVLNSTVAAFPVGTRVTLRLLREGKPMVIGAKLEQRPRQATAPATPGGSKDKLGGIRVAELTPAMRRAHGVPNRVQSGVVVTDVKPGGRAARAGLRPGDVIVRVNRKPVSSVREFSKQLAATKGALLILAYRGDATLFIAVGAMGD